MSRYLLIAAAGVAAVALASPAHAHAPSHSFGVSQFSAYHGGPVYHYPSGSRYSYRYGTRFSHGYYFGRRNFYWNRRYWSRRYGCYCYWNPYMSSWYYWYAPGNRYYPLSYIGNAPPTPIAPPAGGVVGDPDAAMPPDGPPLP